jgi:hypothetical protein
MSGAPTSSSAWRRAATRCKGSPGATSRRFPAPWVHEIKHDLIVRRDGDVALASNDASRGRPNPVKS